MNRFEIRFYNHEVKALWNGFVRQAKNATFLFQRDYMDYHQDRFKDFSLMVFDGEKLCAIFPANRVGDTLFSHQGLTYGGLVLDEKARMKDVSDMFEGLMQFAQNQGINEIIIKQIPQIYSMVPSDELAYLMFILKADLVCAETLSIIKPKETFRLSRDRLAGLKRGQKHQLEVEESDDFALFWNKLLRPNLDIKYRAKPVHTLTEIELLKNRFPKNIRLFLVNDHGKAIAGTVVFEYKNVARSQYISALGNKNNKGSLDFLHHFLLTETFKDKPYFDFGSSNKNQGKNINESLMYWKEGFGARTITQNFYSVKTKNHTLLKGIWT